MIYRVFRLYSLFLDFVSGKRDSNPRPLAWEANALPTELFPQIDLQIYSKFFKK